MHASSADAAQRLLQAVETLHQPGGDTSNIAGANAWLEAFEREDLAWKGRG